MARVHYWHYLLNEEGQPIEAAIISVMQSESTTYVWLYDVEIGGTAFINYERSGSTGNPQLRTNSDGFFEFWISDDSDLSGHGYAGIKLKIKWSKPGVISDGYIDNIEFSISPEPVLETDYSVIGKNKLISNKLAYRWESAVKRVIELPVIEWSTDITTGNKYYYIVPDEFNGMNLIRVAATALVAGETGSTTIGVYNVTTSHEMLSTLMAIESGEVSTRTSDTPGVIDAAYDNITTGNILCIHIDAVSSTAPKGLIVELVFEIPTE